jgi:hypothetical protein
MKAWLRDLLDALLLRGATLARIADRPDAFLRGLLVILAVALVVGLPALFGQVVEGFRPPEVVEPGDVRPDLTGAFDMARPWLRNAGVPEFMIDQVLQMAEGNTAMAGAIAMQIEQLPTALPRPLAAGFVALGRWVSTPFAGGSLPLAAATLSTWLGYGIWVMLAAKLIGGRGTLHGFFGATAFFAAPHVFDVFTGLPVLGAILRVVAFIWGLVIYCIATAVSHKLSAGRTLVAVFAPFVLVLIIVALVLLAFAAWAVVAGASWMQ